MQSGHRGFKHGQRFLKAFPIFGLFLEFLGGHSFRKVKTLLQGVVLNVIPGIGNRWEGREERHKRKIFLLSEKRHIQRNTRKLNVEWATGKVSIFFWKGIIISIRIGSSSRKMLKKIVSPITNKMCHLLKAVVIFQTKPELFHLL